MTWNYTYNPVIWLSFLTVLLLIALGVYSWPRRKMPGVLPFIAALLFAALWLLGSIMEFVNVDVSAKIFWIKFQAAWHLPAATAITCFILDYVWPGRWITRRVVTLLAIPSLLILLMIVTNDVHLLVWSSFEAGAVIVPQFGVLSWIGIAIGYSLLIVNFTVFVWLFLHSPQQRGFVIIIIAAQLVMRVLYLLERTQVVQPGLPGDSISIGFAYVLYAIALFRFHVLDPIPLARQAVIAQMPDGMLVLDLEERVLGLNPAAAQILSATEKQVKGRSVRDLLPVYLEERLSEGECEVVFKTEQQEIRHFILAVSALKDWRGLDAGRLLLLRDVTAQKLAQEQLLEQQRALAIMNEREHLARELHDSIGQTLGYAGFQVEAACTLIEKGHVDTASTQLNRLTGILHEAHADVRAHILHLQAAPGPQQPYFTALHHYLKGFTHNHGIQIVFHVDDRLPEDYFSADVGMQIFRILQESLSNARKHGKAHCIEVAFTRQDHLVRMTIQDDGAGFDGGHIVSPPGSHFGLRFMHERAQELGGSLIVVSKPGKGTQVVLEIPEEEQG
jgi:PAS domain S-box-containing protein